MYYRGADPGSLMRHNPLLNAVEQAERTRQYTSIARPLSPRLALA